MTRSLPFIIVFLIAVTSLFAQNVLEGDLSINSAGADADAAAILDVQSTTRGVVFPRMTTAQRTAIASPIKGLLVYDIDLKRYCYHDSLSWICIATATESDSCTTLDGAYDCGGPGAGRTITVDAGSVRLQGTIASPNTTLEVENEGTGSVATFRDELPAGAGTENLVTVGEDGGDALRAEVLGAGNVNEAVHALTVATAARAGLFENTNVDATADALEGYNHGDRHGVFGHTDVKVPVVGSFSIVGQPASGVMGISSNTELRKGTGGVSVNSDGTWGKTYTQSGFKTVADPRMIIAGAHGTIESAQSTTEDKDYFGVFGIPVNNGNGVLGVGGGFQSPKGHGVVGVSAWSTVTPSTNAGIWGITREGQTWAAMNATFPLEEEAHNKKQVGVLGQSKNFVAVWGESDNKVGVIGNVNGRKKFTDLPAPKMGVFGHNGGAGYGVQGTGLSDAFTDAGVRATGKHDKDKAAALEIHDGAIRVSKDSATHTPADVIDVVAGGWATIWTCPADDGDGGGPHDHVQAYMSSPIVIHNQYVDADRSVILVSVMTEIPAVSIQLIGQAHGMFTVAITVHSANLSCETQPPSGPYKVHYMIVNK